AVPAAGTCRPKYSAAGGLVVRCRLRAGSFLRLAHFQHLVGRHMAEDLGLAGHPADLQRIHALRIAEPEMNPLVAVAAVASAAENNAVELAALNGSRTPRAYRSAAAVPIRN